MRVKRDGLFSQTELSIIKMTCEEKTAKEIAILLNLSKRSIEGYRTRIMDKTGSKSLVGVVIYAITNGLFQAIK